MYCAAEWYKGWYVRDASKDNKLSDRILECLTEVDRVFA